MENGRLRFKKRGGGVRAVNLAVGEQGDGAFVAGIGGVGMEPGVQPRQHHHRLKQQEKSQGKRRAAPLGFPGIKPGKRLLHDGDNTSEKYVCKGFLAGVGDRVSALTLADAPCIVGRQARFRSCENGLLIP